MKRACVIFLASFVIQAAVILSLKVPITCDAGDYNKVAVSIAEGRGFTIDGNPLGGYIKQGHVLFLALVYKIFGHSVLAAKFIQALLVSLTCVIVYKLAGRLFGERIGCCSGVVTAFHPAFLILSSHLISENLFTFLLSLAILFLVLAMEKDSLRLYLVSGLLLGAAAQVRFVIALFPFFILAGLLLQKKKAAFKAGVIIILSVILLQVPWSVRNYVTFGHLNPFMDYAGPLWLGTYAPGDAHQDNPELKRALAQMNKEVEDNCRGKSCYSELNKRYFKAGFANIGRYPVEYLLLAPKKILRLWIGSYCNLYTINLSFSNFAHNRALVKQRPFILLWKLWGLAFSLAVFCLGLAGMALGFKRRRRLLPLYLAVAYFTLVHMVVFANTIVGIPALPYLIIFAVFGGDLLLNKIREG